jgi:cyanophycinase
MAGQVALAGGDEFRTGCESMDRALLEAAGVKRPRVLIVPTAAAKHSPTKAAENGVSYFSSLGAEASPLMVLGPDTAGDEGLVSQLDAADLVYITGGDPDYLLDTLRDSLFLSRLLKTLARGAIVAGSSAGAMVLGSWMSFGGGMNAMGVLTDVAVLPHHERSDPGEVAKRVHESAPAGTEVLGIDAKTCCFGGPGGWTVLGQGAVTLYSSGSWQRFESGQPVPLQTSLSV